MIDKQTALRSLRPALGIGRARGKLKASPEDFVVREIPNWTPTGEGEHAVLWIEKTGLNTEWLARQLARFAGVPNRSVSFAGRKDRLARTWQWFSVHLPGVEIDWASFECPGATIHAAERHSRKVRTGALRGNAFEIVIRDLNRPLDTEAVESMRSGVPNYFGPQRFGKHNSNLRHAETIAHGGRVRKSERALAVSAARSAVFNAVLESRVFEGNWNAPTLGDVVQFEGSRSLYVVDADSLHGTEQRAAALDVHPTGPLWGRGDLMTTGSVESHEQSVADVHQLWTKATEVAGASMARRALRMVPANFSYVLDEHVARLSFELPAGSFATAFVNELVADDDDQRSKT
ncbi:MAG: tRNA pseudouridine(13) synthase TruD [Pseudomonadota bacterium]